MLAAESAWRILHAEHAQMRKLLERIETIAASPDWREPGPALNSLARLVQRLQSFDDATHRPKGVALFAALRGREADTDALIQQLETDCGQRDDLLNEVLAQLKALQLGHRSAAEPAEKLLARYAGLLRRDLDLEDSTLHAESAKLLAPEQWSVIASSISTVMTHTAPRRAPKTR